MLKLYKFIGNQIHYWETWEENEKMAIVHWGIVGEEGQNKEVKSQLFSSYRKKIQKETEQKLKEGYSALEDDEVAYLEIEYAVDGFGTEQDLDKRHRLEEHLNQLLGWTGLGHVDGGSIGSGTMEVGCVVVDFDIAKKVIEENLKATEFANFERIFKTEPVSRFIVVTLNDRIMPVDRGEVYEDPLSKYLQSKGIGEVAGGGTMQMQNGEVEYCNIEIELNDIDSIEEKAKAIIEKLEGLGAPKGSKLRIEATEQVIGFGIKEGLGIYLDGVNLEEEVYKNCDSNVVLSEVKKLTKDDSEIVRFWEGETETGLYFYSSSFDDMKESIQSFVNDYPLCRGARIEKIA